MIQFDVRIDGRDTDTDITLLGMPNVGDEVEIEDTSVDGCSDFIATRRLVVRGVVHRWVAHREFTWEAGVFRPVLVLDTVWEASK